jgi:hypothetical protein
MRNRTLHLLAAVAMYATPVLADEAAPKTLSRSEVHTLPEATVVQRVADQIADYVLLPNPPDYQADMFSLLGETLGLDPHARRSKIADATRTRLPGLIAVRLFPNDDPAKMLRGLRLVSKPYATQTAGLCRIDIYWVSYLPSGEDKGADTPLHMTYLHVNRSFRVLSAPSSAVAAPADATQHAVDDAACAKLDPDKDPFFGASDDAHAMRAAWLFQALEAGFKMKTPPFDLTCHDQTTPEMCRGLIESKLSGVLLEVSCSNLEPMVCFLETGQDKWVHVTYDAGPAPKITRAEIPPKFAPVMVAPRKP